MIKQGMTPVTRYLASDAKLNRDSWVVLSHDHESEVAELRFALTEATFSLEANKREVAALTDKLNNEYAAHALTQSVLESLQNRWATRPVTDQLQEEVAALRAALERSKVALDDWLNTYAAELCDQARVGAAWRRINEFGTIGYIATVQKQNRAALDGTAVNQS